MSKPAINPTHQTQIGSPKNQTNFELKITAENVWNYK